MPAKMTFVKPKNAFLASLEAFSDLFMVQFWSKSQFYPFFFFFWTTFILLVNPARQNFGRDDVIDEFYFFLPSRIYQINRFWLEFFDTRDRSKKSGFLQRLGWGQGPKTKQILKNFDSTWSGNFSDHKSHVFQWGFWRVLAQIPIVNGGQTP